MQVNRTFSSHLVHLHQCTYWYCHNIQDYYSTYFANLFALSHANGYVYMCMNPHPYHHTSIFYIFLCKQCRCNLHWGGNKGRSGDILLLAAKEKAKKRESSSIFKMGTAEDKTMKPPNNVGLGLPSKNNPGQLERKDFCGIKITGLKKATIIRNHDLFRQISYITSCSYFVCVQVCIYTHMLFFFFCNTVGYIFLKK